jgi:aromatic ring hydroxylase
LTTATSYLTGEVIKNRFINIDRNADDLLKKTKKTKIVRKAYISPVNAPSSATDRDAINALNFVTYELDKTCSTKYDKRFLKCFWLGILV